MGARSDPECHVDGLGLVAMAPKVDQAAGPLTSFACQYIFNRGSLSSPPSDQKS